MANLIKNSTAESRTPIFLPKGSSNTYRNTNEFFFYSNNPETVLYSHTADQGKWLNKATVTGVGQVYTWHLNNVVQNYNNKTITAGILIYNPNSFAIEINVSNYGLTSLEFSSIFSDSNAWKDYINGNSLPDKITIEKYGYSNLFMRNIPYDYVYGIIAKLTITNKETMAAASATLFDIAYISNSGGATSCAPNTDSKNKRRRGHGDGFFQTVEFEPIIFSSDTREKSYSIAGVEDTIFAGADCSYIIDDSGVVSGYLYGGYGQIFSVKLSIINNLSTAKNFKVFIGSHGGKTMPFVYMGSDLANYNTRFAEAGQYTDVIETGLVAPNTKIDLEFSTVVPAASGAPLVIGAYPC